MSNAQTCHVEHTAHLIASFGDRLEAHDLQHHVAMVCDTNTYTAVAEKLEGQLPPLATVINLGLQVKPTLARAETLAGAIADAGAVIVVGSGTLTDLCKYACHTMGKTLVSIPTAASMNGYTSATASLIGADGHKKSYPCKAPDYVWLDSAIYANAPIALSQAGLGDTLCRSSVQMDALLSHLLFGTWYDVDYFKDLMALERDLIRHVEKLYHHDEAYIAELMNALILSGNAMREAGTSAPASQGEHMIAHTLEQSAPLQMQKFLHGAHIAVTSLTMTRLQAFMVRKPVEVNLMHYASQMEAVPEHEGGSDKLKKLREISEKDMALAWQQVQALADTILLAPDVLEETLLKASLPTDPEMLGVLRQTYVDAVRASFATRDRLTFLDIAAMRAR